VIAQITGLFHFGKPVAIPCGSELARDGGMSGTIIVDWTTAIASKLAPTVVLYRTQILILSEQPT